jgi:hypothetical protein
VEGSVVDAGRDQWAVRGKNGHEKVCVEPSADQLVLDTMSVGEGRGVFTGGIIHSSIAVVLVA